MKMLESIKMMGAEDFAREFMAGNCRSCPVSAGCDSKWTILECLDRQKEGKAKKSAVLPLANCLKRCVEWLETDNMGRVVEL